MTQEELADKFDDEHLNYFYARYLIRQGFASKEKLNREINEKLGFSH